MVDVDLLESDVVVQQVVHHVKLKILLECLQSVLILCLSVDHTAHEVVVRLVEVTEVRDLLA